MNTNTQTETPTPETDACLSDVNQDYLNLAALCRKHESASYDLKRQIMQAACGYIDATQIAKDAVRSIRCALSKGMTHSRQDLENACDSLMERLDKCTLAGDALEIAQKSELAAAHAQIAGLRDALTECRDRARTIERYIANGEHGIPHEVCEIECCANAALVAPAPLVVSRSDLVDTQAQIAGLRGALESIASAGPGKTVFSNGGLSRHGMKRLARQALAAHEARKKGGQDAAKPA